MTNAEKYKEVFGFEPPDCPTWHCPSCPVFKECSEHHFSEIAHKWWNSEYKEGKCKSCRHRDPEDKKCDCGGLERQGCYFPVSDDYYCKYYKRGEE